MANILKPLWNDGATVIGGAPLTTGVKIDQSSFVVTSAENILTINQHRIKVNV